MSIEENKALIRRYADEVWNRGNLAVLDEVVSPEYVFDIPGSRETIEGPQGLRDLICSIRGAFPDHRLTIEEMIGEGDTVAWRWTMRGTHRGASMGIPPTGRQVTTTGISIYRIVGGTIVRRWGEADTLGLLLQLGAIGAPEARATVQVRERGGQ